MRDVGATAHASRRLRAGTGSQSCSTHGGRCSASPASSARRSSTQASSGARISATALRPSTDRAVPFAPAAPLVAEVFRCADPWRFLVRVRRGAFRCAVTLPGLTASHHPPACLRADQWFCIADCSRPEPRNLTTIAGTQRASRRTCRTCTSAPTASTWAACWPGSSASCTGWRSAAGRTTRSPGRSTRCVLSGSQRSAAVSHPRGRHFSSEHSVSYRDGSC